MRLLATAVLLGACLLVPACVDEGRMPAPRQAPAEQPAAFNRSETELFREVAASLVGAHEALGRLESFYDTEGDCGALDPEEDCYVWRFRSVNPTMRVMLTRYQPQGTAGDAVGTYEGFVQFRDRHTQQLVRIDLRLTFTGDDLRVHLSTRDLPARGTNS